MNDGSASSRIASKDLTLFRAMTPERYLTDAEATRLMDAARTRRHVRQPRDYAFLALAVNTGLRPAEIRALTRGDVHATARPTPWVRITRRKKRKAAPVVEAIEISDELAAVVVQHLATIANCEDATLFPREPRWAQRMFRRYASIAGIHSRHSLYVLRHTAATRLYSETLDINAVQSMLGHESPDTSTIYAHVRNDVLANAVNSLRPFV